MKIHIHSDRPDLHVGASLYIAAMQTPGISLTRGEDADVVINIDSIHNTGLVRGKKTVYWELDDNMHKGKNTRYYDVDLLYIVSKERLSLYPPKTKWLPVAMEPTIHYRWQFPIEYDWVNISSIDPIAQYEYRREVLNMLRAFYPNARIGTCQVQNYAKELSKGKVLVNIMPEGEDGIPLINTRIYESMGIGMLLNDYHHSLDELIKRDIHYIAFQSPAQAVEKMRFYLSHDYQRDKIASQGKNHILEHHTWKHRLNQLLKDIESL